MVSEMTWALEGDWVSDLGWALEQGWASGTSLQGWGRGLGSGLGLRSAPEQISHRPPWPPRWRPTPPPQTRPGRRTRPRRSLNGVQTPERSLSSWMSPPWWTLPGWEGKWVRVLWDPNFPLGPYLLPVGWPPPRVHRLTLAPYPALGPECPCNSPVGHPPSERPPPQIHWARA